MRGSGPINSRHCAMRSAWLGSPAISLSGLPGVTSHQTRSNFSRLSAVRATSRCPSCGGLNEPPKRPIRRPAVWGGRAMVVWVNSWNALHARPFSQVVSRRDNSSNTRCELISLEYTHSERLSPLQMPGTRPIECNAFHQKPSASKLRIDPNKPSKEKLDKIQSKKKL